MAEVLFPKAHFPFWLGFQGVGDKILQFPPIDLQEDFP